MTNEELVKCIQARDNEKYYMTKLWKQNYGLVNMLVLKYGLRSEYEDLLQEAFLGLYTAVMKYDTERGVAFSTYALYWIKCRIIRYMQNKVSLVRIPANARETIIHYKKAVDDFTKKYGRKPTEEEIINLIKVDGNTLYNIQKTAYQMDIRSLSETTADESDITLENLIPSNTDTEGDAIHNYDRKKMQILLWTIVGQLSEKASEILKMRYKEGMSQKEISNQIGISERQIAQIESDARRKIRMSPLCIGLGEYYAQYLQ